MSDPNYEDDQTQHEPEDDSSSLEGKGWDILAGGQQNAYAMGGDNPFDEDKPAPTPYTDDDEADWILTTGTTPETAAADEGAPRDLSPEELSQLSPSDAGPVTAPAYLFPGGPDTPPESAPSGGDAVVTPGVSPGVSVMPVGPEGSPTGAPVDPAPVSPAFADAFSTHGSTLVPQDLAPTGPGSISPGVDVTPLGPDGEPMYEPTAPLEPPMGTMPTAPGGDVMTSTYTDPPLGGSKDSPEPTLMEPGLEPPMGGEIIPPEGPLVTPAPYAPSPDVPPWSIPKQPGLPQGGFFAGASYQPTDPFSSAEDNQPIPGADIADLEPDESLRRMLITEDRVNELWDEITETFNLIVSDVRGHFHTTELSIADLKHARELLLAGTQNYDNAERLVMEVKARLRLEEKVRQWSRTRGTWLGVYLIVWLLLLSTLSLLTNKVIELAVTFVPLDLANTFLPSLFGGLGGVIGAIWILVKHISVKRDFDPIHTSWYVLNPFLGMAMGVVTYLLIWVSSNTFLKVGNVDGTINFTSGIFAALLYLLCIVVGFNQNVLWSLIDRIVDTIFPRPADDQSAATDVTSSGHSVVVEALESREPKA